MDLMDVVDRVIIEFTPEVLSDLQSTGDFVYVEESVDFHFQEMCGKGINRLQHMFGCGLVFQWIETKYNISPPTWYINEVKEFTKCGTLGDWE